VQAGAPSDPCQVVGCGSGRGGHRAPRFSRRQTVVGPGRGATTAGERGGATCIGLTEAVGASRAARALRSFEVAERGWGRALRLGHGAAGHPGEPGRRPPLWTTRRALCLWARSSGG
jgi:hypothetical protein